MDSYIGDCILSSTSISLFSTAHWIGGTIALVLLIWNIADRNRGGSR